MSSYIEAVRLWNILCWNIRGLNDKKKWTLIFDKIKESGCHVICFQETKRERHLTLFILGSFVQESLILLPSSHLLVDREGFPLFGIAPVSLVFVCVPKQFCPFSRASINQGGHLLHSNQRVCTV
jgi:hypothetical protein